MEGGSDLGGRDDKVRREVNKRVGRKVEGIRRVRRRDMLCCVALVGYGVKVAGELGVTSEEKVEERGGACELIQLELFGRARASLLIPLAVPPLDSLVSTTADEMEEKVRTSVNQSIEREREEMRNESEESKQEQRNESRRTR